MGDEQETLYSVCPAGIFKDCPAHADEVGTVFLQKRLGLDRGGNPSCQKDGKANRLLHSNRHIPEIAGFPMTGTDKAVHAAGEVEQIYAAVLQQSTGLHTVLNRASPGRIVTATQPQGNGIVLSHSLPNRLDDFSMEADAVFHGLGTIRIGSLIGQRGEKLVEEIAVGRKESHRQMRWRSGLDGPFPEGGYSCVR